jgi:hypothetical protein
MAGIIMRNWAVTETYGKWMQLEFSTLNITVILTTMATYTYTNQLVSILEFDSNTYKLYCKLISLKFCIFNFIHINREKCLYKEFGIFYNIQSQWLWTL